MPITLNQLSWLAQIFISNLTWRCKDLKIWSSEASNSQFLPLNFLDSQNTSLCRLKEWFYCLFLEEITILFSFSFAAWASRQYQCCQEFYFSNNFNLKIFFHQKLANFDHIDLSLDVETISERIKIVLYLNWNNNQFLATLFKQFCYVSVWLSFNGVITEASTKQFFLKVYFVKEPPKRAKKSDITLRMMRNPQQIDLSLLFQKRCHWNQQKRKT